MIVRPVIRDIISPVIRSVLDPGVGVSDIATIQRLLFGNGQPGVAYIPTLSSSMISANSFGTGVETLVDLRGLNNGTQASAGSRPAWGRVPKSGRRNLLFYTEDFSNAAWAKNNTGTGSPPIVTANAAIAPDGSMTADQIDYNAGSSGRSILQQSTSSNLPATIRHGAYVKAATPADVGKTFFLRDGSNTGVYTLFTLTADWQRITVTGSTAAGSTYVGIELRTDTSTKSSQSASILMWGAMMEEGSVLTPYQRVVTTFDITESGQRDCYYLRADGVDDAMATAAIDFSGTDKVTVFAGIRKRSDAARGTIVELGPSIDSNNGSFHLTAPNAASATFAFESKGTTLRDAVISSKASPIYAVLTAGGDIAGDLARLQFNNETAVENTGDQGSGNYSNAVLNLFRRSDASLPFNGDCFAMVVAGGSYDSATKNTIKAIIAKYTPTVVLP
jgi:hypothetical protein